MAQTEWETFADAMKECQRRAHMSELGVADALRVSVRSVQNWDSGAGTPNPRNRLRLARLFKLQGTERRLFIQLGTKRTRPRAKATPRPVDVLPQAPIGTSSNTSPDISLHHVLAERRAVGGRAWKVILVVGLLTIMAGLSLLPRLSFNNMSAAGYESTISSLTDETFCPGTSALCQMAEGSVRGRVHMVCWQDATWIDGQSHRWFYVQAPNGSEGFVHAAAIPNQTGTPNCSSVSWLNAAAWALDQDGQVTIPSYATSSTNAVYWSSWSWLFSYDAWKIGAGHTPNHVGSTAQQTWNKYRANGTWPAASSNPPRGSLVFFSYGSVGSVAVSLGDGWVETTQGTSESQKLPVTHMTLAQVGLTQIGYVPPSLV